jgi:fructosamine-3-kinase
VAYAIPRLLGALEHGDRKIKPSLLDGDLWEGNAGTTPNGDVSIFESAAFYDHHEMEVTYWRGWYDKISDHTQPF